MESATDGTWLMTAMAVGALGAGFFIFGIRQKEPWTLAIGVLLNVLPFVLSSVLPLLLLSAAVIAGGLWLKERF